VLEALGAAPGSGPAAVAKASGVSTGVAAATLSRLVKQGRARRLEAGRYAIVEAASVTGPAEGTGETQATPPPPPKPG
jgi:DNA-binding IclR family transcriptional regulator